MVVSATSSAERPMPPTRRHFLQKDWQWLQHFPRIRPRLHHKIVVVLHHPLLVMFVRCSLLSFCHLLPSCVHYFPLLSIALFVAVPCPPLPSIAVLCCLLSSDAICVCADIICITTHAAAPRNMGATSHTGARRRATAGIHDGWLWMFPSA